jgi:hypothetical protein
MEGHFYYKLCQALDKQGHKMLLCATRLRFKKGRYGWFEIYLPGTRTVLPPAFDIPCSNPTEPEHFEENRQVLIKAIQRFYKKAKKTKKDRDIDPDKLSHEIMVMLYPAFRKQQQTAATIAAAGSDDWV